MLGTGALCPRCSAAPPQWSWRIRCSIARFRPEADTRISRQQSRCARSADALWGARSVPPWTLSTIGIGASALRPSAAPPPNPLLQYPLPSKARKVALRKRLDSGQQRNTRDRAMPGPTLLAPIAMTMRPKIRHVIAAQKARVSGTDDTERKRATR
jgi:hypothetical protein